MEAGTHGLIETKNYAPVNLTALASEFHGGSQSVAVGHDAIVTRAFSGAPEKVELDVWMNPVHGTAPWTTDLPTNATAVFWHNSDGKMEAYDGSTIVTNTAFAVAESNWSHYVVAVDYGAKRWGVMCNGTTIFDGLVFYSQSLDGFSALRIIGSSQYISHLDDVAIRLVPSNGTLLMVR